MKQNRIQLTFRKDDLIEEVIFEKTSELKKGLLKTLFIEMLKRNFDLSIGGKEFNLQVEEYILNNVQQVSNISVQDIAEDKVIEPSSEEDKESSDSKNKSFGSLSF